MRYPNPILDIVPGLNRQIGKTSLLVDKTIKMAKKNPDIEYLYITPTLYIPKSLKEKVFNLPENVSIVSLNSVDDLKRVKNVIVFNDISYKSIAYFLDSPFLDIPQFCGLISGNFDTTTRDYELPSDEDSPEFKANVLLEEE